MEGATAGAKRCFEVLDRADDVVDTPDAVSLENTTGAIAFNRVSFGYGSAEPVLHDIDLPISPNQIVAIVGGTGAGKSTLLSLVPRFYDPSEGRITIDGRDLRSVTKKSFGRTSASCCRIRCSFPRLFARTSPTDGRMRPMTKFARQRSALKPTSSSAAFLPDTTVQSENAEDILASANGNASELPAHF